MTDPMQANNETQTEANTPGGGTTLVEGDGFKESCFSLRGLIETCKNSTESMMIHPVFQGEQTSHTQHGEMKANIMLAFRHLEDARMRMGKAIQAYDGGESCYPR